MAVPRWALALTELYQLAGDHPFAGPAVYKHYGFRRRAPRQHISEGRAVQALIAQNRQAVMPHRRFSQSRNRRLSTTPLVPPRISEIRGTGSGFARSDQGREG